jgi:hypothetical protein
VLGHEINEDSKFGRQMAAGRPQYVESARVSDVFVEYALERARGKLLPYCEIRQACNAKALLGHVDQWLDCIRDRRRWRHDIDILTTAAEGPALELTARRVAVLQAGVHREVLRSPWNTSVSEIAGRGNELEPELT